MNFISDDSNLILISNNFSKNYAECGGAIKFQYKIPKNFINSNHFNGNKALVFGIDYASEPFKIWYLKNFSNSGFSNFIFCLFKIIFVYLVSNESYKTTSEDKNYYLNLSLYKLTSGSFLPTSIFFFAITDYFDQKYSYNFTLSFFIFSKNKINFFH